MADADPAIPLPSQIPDGPNSTKPAKAITRPQSLAAAVKSLPSNTDAFLIRLQKCISTPAGNDTILLLLCYCSKLLSSLFASASISTLHHKARRLVALALSLPATPDATGTAGSVKAAEVLLAPASATGLAANLMALSLRLKALSGMLSDVRAFSRLWGLLGMYFWAKRLILAKKHASPDAKPAKPADKLVAWASLVSCTLFQGMENVAYLGGKNVLPVSPRRQAELFRWSSRFWSLYVALDVGRLVRELLERRNTRQERRVARAKAAAENMDPAAAREAAESHEAEEREWLVKWRRGFLRQLAWAPLTVHYSSEKPLLSDGTIGLLGVVPGFIQVVDLWKTAGQS